MKNFKLQETRTIFSFLVLFVFIFLALASHPLKNIPSSANAFALEKKIDDPSDTGNYIIKYDGTKIYGTELSIPYGIGRIKGAYVDGVSINPNEVKGYRQDGDYYGRNGLEFLPRIVYGKISIYKGRKTYSGPTNAISNTRTEYVRPAYYTEKNNDGKLHWVYNINQVRELVKDCPLALEMISKEKIRHWKIMKENPGYLIKVISVYNNNCKELK